MATAARTGTRDRDRRTRGVVALLAVRHDYMLEAVDRAALEDSHQSARAGGVAADAVRSRKRGPRPKPSAAIAPPFSTSRRVTFVLRLVEVVHGSPCPSLPLLELGARQHERREQIRCRAGVARL